MSREGDSLPRAREPRLDHSLAGGLARGLACGALAGAAAGVIDGLWSWSSLGQFLPGAGGKLALLLFLAASYGLVFGLAGAAGAGLVALFDRATRLGDLVRGALALHGQARARDPRDALIGLSLVLAGVPVLAGLLGTAYLTALPALALRKHMGLVIAVSMGLSLGALALAAPLTFVLARPLEVGLRALAGRHATLARALSSIWAPVAAAAALMATAGIVAAVRAWETLALLPLRPWSASLLALVLAPPAWLAVARLDRLARGRLGAGRRALPAALILSLVALVIAAGSPEAVRKSAGQYSGLGGPITRVARGLVDLDRDGFSPILGGGDCDDWNRHVHPGAGEIPDDGVDQNCVGGDPTAARSPGEAGFAPVPASVPADFNVVFITIDTIRADHLSAYGYERPTSPHIDAVAADGALFLNGWAHAPSTRYSIPAILTGRYPLAVHYDDSIQGWPGLDEKNTTIAELMRVAGMATGAILNYWYFDEHRRMDQGFDSYDNENKRYHTHVSGKGPAETAGSSSRQQTDKALQFVARHADERFFLWVHYYDPHYRYEAHTEVPSFGDSEIDRYDQEIRFTDMHIGRLVDDLKRRGLYERTAIVITGDHGEGFGEHGIDLHGYHLYAAQTRVPLIVRVPGLAPVRATTPASHVDLLPTLANLAGLPPSAEMMGQSLLAIIAGQADADADRHVFQQLSYENNNEMRAAASKQCHVIYNVSPDTSWELYRVDVDPQETRDVIDTPGPCAGARAALEAWYDRAEIPTGAAEALLDARPEVARPTPVDFGDEVRLLGVDLPAGPVRAGQPFEVTYTFEARGPLPGGWKIFAHFEGPGRFLGDHEPPRPFSWWRDGQFIRYSQTVTVPKNTRPGAYHLWMGLFRKGERRPARGEGVEVREDRADVGTVQVRR